jgi:hypothetical protein
VSLALRILPSEEKCESGSDLRPISRTVPRPSVNIDHSSWLCASCVPDFRFKHSQGGTQAHLGFRLRLEITFRATGITAYLKNGGKLEIAQQIAAHDHQGQQGLYDRRDDDVNLDEVERIGI